MVISEFHKSFTSKCIFRIVIVQNEEVQIINDATVSTRFEAVI